jgi:hypothetical protein
MELVLRFAQDDNSISSPFLCVICVSAVSSIGHSMAILVEEKIELVSGT